MNFYIRELSRNWYRELNQRHSAVLLWPLRFGYDVTNRKNIKYVNIFLKNRSTIENVLNTFMVINHSPSLKVI